MARDGERERAIFAAALELLSEQGYESMTIDGIAERAQASKATIYKRWANKAEVVMAAFGSLDAEDEDAVPDTGSLRSDLVAVMVGLRERSLNPHLEMLSELSLAARRDEALAVLLDDQLDDDEPSAVRAVLARAVERRELPRSVDTELVHDVAEAMILRRLQKGSTLDAPFIARVVDHVILPLLRPNPGRK